MRKRGESRREKMLGEGGERKREGRKEGGRWREGE